MPAFFLCLHRLRHYSFKWSLRVGLREGSGSLEAGIVPVVLAVLVAC